MEMNSSQQVLCQWLREGRVIWVLYIDIVKFQEVEFSCGYSTCKKILEDLELELETTLQQQSYFLFTKTENKGGDDFVVYFVPSAYVPWHISEVVEKWLKPLEDRFNQKIAKYVPERISLRSGLVECKNEDNRSPEYILYAAGKEAFLLNKSESDLYYFPKKNEITNILQEPEKYLKSAFQPIIETRSCEVFGFEALARVNEPTIFNKISDLFPFAEKIGQLYPIETLCRGQAIVSFPSIRQGRERLFLNINPNILMDKKFYSGQTRKRLEENGLSPTDVILEITERSAIEDFANFRKALSYYRDQGYLIALDDVGAGFSSLQSIAELHPDFIKIDRSLIHGINTEPIKWALLETFVTFSKRIGCHIVAEGIETAEEMQTVVQLGVDYLQGYFIAKPSFTRPIINPLSLEILASKQRCRSKHDNAIISLVEHLALFDHQTKVSSVEQYFREHSNQWSVGITEDDRLVGVVQRDNLFGALGTRYGVSLFAGKNITQLMDKNPLIVEDTTPVEVASKIAMQRPDAQLYDGIVVVHQRKPIGMVKVATLMKAMADFQIQIARGVNPLTGLPGNELIDQEIRKQLELNQSFGILYIDLNKFKNYNDLHGFRQGDLAIIMLSEILLFEAQQTDTKAFVGHIGGDDFIAIMPGEILNDFASTVLSRFEQETSRLVGADILSVTLAGLQVDSGTNWTTVQIAQQAAQVKKEVKALGGNAYVCRKNNLIFLQ